MNHIILFKFKGITSNKSIIVSISILCSTITLAIPTYDHINCAQQNVFANFGSSLLSNPTVYATVLSIIALYILVLVRLRKLDKIDLDKVSRPIKSAHFI